MWRVFMCTAGTSGERICATSEMPPAQKRGSSAAPGICLRNSGLNSPKTVETLTPTFSKTRPCISAMVPPPRSSPAGPGSRRHALRTNLPASSSRWVPERSSSICSKAAQMRSRSASNHTRAASLRWAIVASSGRAVGVLVGERIESRGLTEGLAHYHGGRQGDIERAHGLLQRDAQLQVGRVVHLGRHPRTFAAEQQDIVPLEDDARKGLSTPGGQQDEPAGRPIAEKGGPGIMAADPGRVEVIHGRAADPPVVNREATGFDDVERHPQAGREADE